MTDNSSCYKAFAFRRACKRLGLRHIRTKPYTPRTNGKAERFIQTVLREWAYARAYDTHDSAPPSIPTLAQTSWQYRSMPPISTLGLAGNNLLRLHSWSLSLKRSRAGFPIRQ
jgi:transposase InsO family protein